MMFKMNCVVFSLLLIIAASNAQKTQVRHFTIGAILGNTNWGKFKKAQICPDGHNITGIAVKLQKNSDKDKTGLNGIKLACTDGSETQEESGHMGEWKAFQYCDSAKTSYVISYNYRSLKSQGRGDDWAGTDFRMVCNNGKVLNGGNLDKGTWLINVNDTASYAKCKSNTNFCGMQIQVEGPAGDTTGMNNVRFLCCSHTDKAEQQDGFTLLASKITIGGKDSRFGFFNINTAGFLTSVKIVYVSGQLTCYDRNKGYANNFGCNILPYDYSIFVTSQDDAVLFPTKTGVVHTHHGWYRTPKLDDNSFQLYNYDAAPYVKVGDEIRFWYGEDLYNRHEGDNGNEHTSVHVYGTFA